MLAFKEGKFGVAWALDGSNSNSQAGHVSSKFVPLVIDLTALPTATLPSLLFALSRQDGTQRWSIGDKPVQDCVAGLAGRVVKGVKVS